MVCWELTFSLTANGEPVYELTYKDKVAIEAFPLGTGTEKGCRFDERFHPARLKNICFWWNMETCLGRKKKFNHYNELAVTLNQEAQKRHMVLRFRLLMRDLIPLWVPRSAKPQLFCDQGRAYSVCHGRWSYGFWIPGDYDTQEYDYTESKLTEIRGLMQKAITDNASQAQFSPDGANGFDDEECRRIVY